MKGGRKGGRGQKGERKECTNEKEKERGKGNANDLGVDDVKRG